MTTKTNKQQTANSVPQASGSPSAVSSKPITMADLMAQGSKKLVNFRRGDEILGKVVVITDSEVILDFGGKAEGVLNKKDLNPDQLQNLKIGIELKAYIASSESESGQIILTLHKALTQGGTKFTQMAKKWQKVITALENKTTLSGKVTDMNKGGLVVEVDGIRGFLPSSQVGASTFSKAGGEESGLSSLVGQDMVVSVLEADPGTSRLILSSRKKIDDTALEKLSQFKSGDQISGKIVAIVPFGILLDIKGVEGVVYKQEASWEPLEDLSAEFNPGQEIETKVLGVDEAQGRINLSVKQLTEDPMAKIFEKFLPDDVVSGAVSETTPTGVLVKLEGGIDGVLPVEKTEEGEYIVGQKANFLIDSVDVSKRRINLAPFITSTKGLIYK